MAKTLKKRDDLVFIDGDKPMEVFSKIDYDFLIMRQIDRIARISLINPNLFIEAVEQLHILLIPYVDEKFDNAIKENKKRLDNLINEAMKDQRITEEEKKLIENEKIIFAKKKYSELVKLIGRRGMLPHWVA